MSHKMFFSLAFLLYNSSFLLDRIIIWKFNVLKICTRIIIFVILLSIWRSRISDNIYSMCSTWSELLFCLLALTFFAIIPFFGLPHHLLCIECFQVDSKCKENLRNSYWWYRLSPKMKSLIYENEYYLINDMRKIIVRILPNKLLWH